MHSLCPPTARPAPAHAPPTALHGPAHCPPRPLPSPAPPTARPASHCLPRPLPHSPPPTPPTPIPVGSGLTLCREQGLPKVAASFGVSFQLLFPQETRGSLRAWEQGRGSRPKRHPGLPAPRLGVFHVLCPPQPGVFLCEGDTLAKRGEGAAIHRAPSNCVCLTIPQI